MARLCPAVRLGRISATLILHHGFRDTDFASLPVGLADFRTLALFQTIDKLDVFSREELPGRDVSAVPEYAFAQIVRLALLHISTRSHNC